MSNKPRFVISSPFDTYSGYGSRARDIIKSIIELNKYKVELLPQKWGETAWGFCEDHPEWEYLNSHIVSSNWQHTKPEIWMQITIPNEFQPVGKYNIGLTAGIESTACKGEWIVGLNRMDMNWVSSHFSKNTFERVSFEVKDKNTQQTSILKLQKPIAVVFEGVDLGTYKPLKPTEIKNISLKDIKESFCYLFVGHWMQGDHGHDRKNVGVLIESFLKAFKDKRGPKPALILKSSIGVSSYMSREAILEKVKYICDFYHINSSNLPNIYLFNGELSDDEMNELYNNPKVKAMVSFTKGEGFGRPLLEFGTTGKPIIASGWSGHMDFLNPKYSSLIPGELEEVHTSAANDWLIKESKWFKIDTLAAIKSMKDIYKHYKEYLKNSRKQKTNIKQNFTRENMKELIENILDKNIPDFPKQVELKLPKLKLPKLEKIK